MLPYIILLWFVVNMQSSGRWAWTNMLRIMDQTNELESRQSQQARQPRTWWNIARRYDLLTVTWQRACSQPGQYLTWLILKALHMMKACALWTIEFCELALFEHEQFERNHLASTCEELLDSLIEWDLLCHQDSCSITRQVRQEDTSWILVSYVLILKRKKKVSHKALF